MTELKNYYVYTFINTDTNKTEYIGMGKGSRINDINRQNNELNLLIKDKKIKRFKIFDKLTHGEADRLETLTIKHIGLENLKQIQQGSNDYNDDTLTIDEINCIDKICNKFKRIEEKASKQATIVDKATPEIIANEIINTMINCKNFGDISKKEFFNPCARTGEIYNTLLKKLGDDIKGNFTMLEPDIEKYIVWLLENKEKGGKMIDIKIINEDFNDFESNKKYDVIIMNPPFVKQGEKFILKAISFLKDKGFLGFVMSPTWRSIVNNKNKLYNQLLEKGGYHFIHMYSRDNTSNIFNQKIGQVDTVIWQKGVKITNTKIINLAGTEYYYDLINYKQTVPVLPSYLYDEYFDQINGLNKKYWSHIKDKSYGEANIKFYDVLYKKNAICNQKNVEISQGKKVLLDREFKKYYIDNIGDEINNTHYMFFYNTNNEKEKIIKTLDFIIDNNFNTLFKNRSRYSDIYIPGIKIK